MEHEALTELARAVGIATDYWDYSGNHRLVKPETLRAVLSSLGHPCDTADDARAELARIQEDEWRHTLPVVTINQEDHNTWIPVHVPHGTQVTCELVLEDGQTLPLNQVDHWVDPRYIDGQLIGRATFDIPAGLPVGWHTIRAHIDGVGTVEAPFANTPATLHLPALRNGRGWGIMAQLYSVAARDSWGIGDTADLARLATWAASHGADFVLINPIHAGEPVAPITPSPYLPSSRLFLAPLYIRPENVAEYATCPPELKDAIEKLRVKARAGQEPLLDRDAMWEPKRQALELLFHQRPTRKRRRDFETWRTEQGRPLERFAAWCALVEKYGEELPAGLASVDDDNVEKELADPHMRERQTFYCWLQWNVSLQFAQAHAHAREAGMAIGIMHDLAVGVHKSGADVWAFPEFFARGQAVGAPADMYNQLGQNWSQPPWRPDTLQNSGYAPLRDMVARLASLGGALRLDHIMGLFRLWWIPADAATPADGTYVRYRFDHMVGIVALEAARAGALIVGEDLGTVEPWVRDYLAERGFLGTAVTWFEYDGDNVRKPADYRRFQLAAVNTHDLPPSAGYLRDEHVSLRARLGILEASEEEEYARSAAERSRMIAALRAEGVLGDDETPEAIGQALYRYVARTPSALVAVSLTDATGERRAQNQPGTDREYPNWSIPLGDGEGATVTIDDLEARESYAALLQQVERDIHGN